MTTTATNSITDSYTESRAKYVMGKVYEDFNHLIIRNFANMKRDDIRKWRDDLLYMMDNKVLIKFQLQFIKPDGGRAAINYELKSDNTIQTDDKSGGLSFYALPDQTRVGIIVWRDYSNAGVNTELEKRGWSPGGEEITGETRQDRSFSKEGYGVKRYTIGL